METTKVSSTFLDDLLSPDDLAAVKAKRRARASVDLSDLVDRAPRPPAVELLGVAHVIFFSQVNTCLNCRAEQEWPTGLVAMHRLKRHGRMTDELIGVALTEGNQYPEHARKRETARSTSIVCAKCVDDARFVVRAATAIQPPIPGTPQWDEQFGWGKTEDIKEREEAWRRKQERIAHELAEHEAQRPPPAFEVLADSTRAADEIEYTSPEDSQ